MSELTRKHCVPCEGGIPALSDADIKPYLAKLSHWRLSDNGKEIFRYLEFKNFYETLAFVNALAWMAHQENHHPDLKLGYNYCEVRYSTHAIGGLSENDFICAAKVNDII